MNNFKKITIGDVAEIKHGWAFPGSGITEYPSENVLVTPGSFKIGGGFKKDNKKFFNGYYPDEYLLTPDDLIVTMTDLSKATDTLGYSALVPNDGKKYLHNQRIGLVQIKSKTIDKNYLYWLLRTYHYQRFIAGAASGTTVKHTSPTQIKSYSFYCPPIETQKQIAGILFSFDDKIELNAKINHNLEEQAKAIFKSWFVDFSALENQKFCDNNGVIMPAGWQISCLTNVADYLNGLAMQNYRPEGEDVGLPVLKIKELRQGMCDRDSERCSSFVNPKYIVHNGDVIFSWSGSLLVDFWCGGDCGLNQHLFKVTSPTFDKWFYYSWTQYYLNEFVAIAADKATTMGHIKRENLRAAIVLIPPRNIYNEIGKLLGPIYETIVRNRIEDKKLAQLRDA